jgi:CRP-like cAMP-binding protein
MLRLARLQRKDGFFCKKAEAHGDRQALRFRRPRGRRYVRWRADREDGGAYRGVLIIAELAPLHRATPGPPGNRLLDKLPPQDRAALVACCDPVELAFGAVLSEPGATIEDVYFPRRSAISLIAPMDGKHAVEVSLAGDEGFFGVPVALGVEVSRVRAVVQGAGSALRMSARHFRRDLERLPRLRDCVNLYIDVVMTQLVQAAGCNRFHVVEQRVARWLLMTADRAHSPTFKLTHEYLAYMLGVRRVGVTEAAGALQQGGLIRYARGVVTIVDRKALERVSCSCYRADLETYKRALG